MEKQVEHPVNMLLVRFTGYIGLIVLHDSESILGLPRDHGGWT